MPASEMANEDVASQRILEEFVTGDVELQRLESALRKFNLFDSLKLVRAKVKHSDFLAYLLDPQQNPGLGDIFLKTLLQSVLKGRMNHCLTPIDVDIWNLSSVVVHRERHNIDILVLDESHQLAVYREQS